MAQSTRPLSGCATMTFHPLNPKSLPCQDTGSSSYQIWWPIIFQSILPLDASAVFAVDRCLSVCLSGTFMYCIQMAKGIVKLLSRPGSPIILVLWPQLPLSNCKENPLSGALNTRGGKICDCWLKSPFISETVGDKPMVAMECRQEVIGGGSIRITSDDLEWPWKAGRKADQLNNAPTDRPRTTKFGRITYVRRRILWVKGAGSKRSPIFEFLVFKRTPLMQNYQI